MGGLTCLPEQVGQLAALEELNLDECSALESLPAEIGQLGALQMLNLSGCISLRSLPREWAYAWRLHRAMRGREARRLLDRLLEDRDEEEQLRRRRRMGRN